MLDVDANLGTCDRCGRKPDRRTSGRRFRRSQVFCQPCRQPLKDQDPRKRPSSAGNAVIRSLRSSRRAQAAPAYRGDIDGLRAVAILLVIAFHARLTGFSGGFVGVDVFFVISGWLITQQLFAPVSIRQAPRLLDFWGRRIRRLVPALALMVGVTFGLTFLVLSPLEWPLVVARGVAALLYVPNMLFAANSGDYFSGPLQQSPFLHTWSLGLEEQFYLVWPPIFAGIGIVTGRRATISPLRAALGTMAVVGIGSFALNLILVRAGSPWAFFGLPTRAWEFACAGFVATALHNRGPLPRWLRGPSVVLGAALITIAVTQFEDGAPFPGWRALLPVCGTLLLLVAGHGLPVGSKGFLRPLETRALRELGQLSYSWYLWHWPFIVLAGLLVPSDTTPVRLAAAGAALGVAALAHYLVENPVRFSRWFKASEWRTYLLGAGATGVCLVVAGALVISGTRQTTGSSHYRKLEEARQSFRYECATRRSTPDGISYCEAGDPSANRTLLLVGDSHALQWQAALSKVAGDGQLKVLLRSMGNCSAVPGGPSTTKGCEAFQSDTTKLIAQLKPDFVVLSDALSSRDRAFSGRPMTWATSAVSYTRDLSQVGIKVGIIRDNPFAGDPLLCLSRGRSTSACTPTAADALHSLDRYRLGERLLEEEGFPFLDVNDRICDPQKCALEHDGTYVFAASGHLTRGFTLTQTDRVTAFLRTLNADTNPTVLS